MKYLTQYEAKQTKINWNILSTANYDCHIICLRQALPDKLYHPFMLNGVLFNFVNGFNDLFCRHLLDSEKQRDHVLFSQFGVTQHCLLPQKDFKQQIQLAIKEQGYCICRLDTFYLNSFKSYYHTKDIYQRILGHKVFVVDWDDKNYYFIDNAGDGTYLHSLPITSFYDAISTSLIARYDKEDFAYYYHYSDTFQLDSTQTIIRKNFEFFLKQQPLFSTSIHDFKTSWLQNHDFDVCQEALLAWLQKSILSALKLELSYQILLEAYPTCAQWLGLTPDEEKSFLLYAKTMHRCWHHFKFLCQSGFYFDDYAKKNILSSLENIYQHEIEYRHV